METRYLDALRIGLRPSVYFGTHVRRYSIEERMRRYGVPGVSITIIERGQIVVSEHYGVQRAQQNEPVTDSTLFQAASLSKLVTALATLRLVSQSVLSLDCDVNAYLSRWKLRANCEAWDGAVTLRRLLNHTAGVSVSYYPGYSPDQPIPTLEAVLNGVPPALTAPVVVFREPGSALYYSEGGVLVEQLALEEVCNQPLRELVDELVLQPLSIETSTFAQPLPAPLQASAAASHGLTGEGLQPPWRVYPEAAAAGLWTTSMDMARLLLSIRRAARGESSKVLSTTIANEMVTPTGLGSVNHDFGLGLWVAGESNTLRYGHAGVHVGFRHLCMLFHETGSGAVVLTNGARGNHLIDEVFATLAEAGQWPGEVYRSCRKVPHPISMTALQNVCGEYQIVGRKPGALMSLPGTCVSISQTDGGLVMRSTVMGDEYFMAQTDTVFGSIDSWLGLRFELGDHKRATGLVVTSRSKDVAWAERIG